MTRRWINYLAQWPFVIEHRKIDWSHFFKPSAKSSTLVFSYARWLVKGLATSFSTHEWTMPSKTFKVSLDCRTSQSLGFITCKNQGLSELKKWSCNVWKGAHMAGPSQIFLNYFTKVFQAAYANMQHLCENLLTNKTNNILQRFS